QLVRPGGLLFLEVPNFQGINLAVLRWSRSPLLAVHNLQVMSRPALRALALAAGMEIVELGYLGGYETQFFDLSHRTVWLRAPLSLAGRARRIGWLDRVNAPWLSGYLFGVFRKSG
ncbi:MAG: hypothetical protein ACREP9_21905, partial [Candidatus Dormibacteraceae bacterium]